MGNGADVSFVTERSVDGWTAGFREGIFFGVRRKYASGRFRTAKQRGAVIATVCSAIGFVDTANFSTCGIIESVWQLQQK